MTERTALIVGGTGIIGRALTEHFLCLDGWNVRVAARNPADQPAGVVPVAVDLLDPGSVAAAAPGLAGVTHVFYTALQARPTLAEEVEPNLSMLRNLVHAVEDSAPDLETISIMQGGKAYGAFLSPYRTPAKESDPRHMPPNFYFNQEDFLRDRQRGKDWGWVAMRPGIVGGLSIGNPMNLTAVIAVYAAISKELGLPLRFPGTPAGYSALHQATDAQLLAQATAWTATNPACRNEIFNVTNGDYFRWENLWPQFADYFEMPVAPPQTIRLTEFMSDKAPLWDRMREKHRLADWPYAQVAAWGFGDAAFHRHWDSVSNVNKLKAFGFLDWVDSEEMFIRLFDQMREARLIP
ncbi:MAG: SDR family oxidoreductase [Rhodospirillaceae bacterium]|nr:SDR family oxidoreductase [Rhodospirillaceae bacterium]